MSVDPEQALDLLERSGVRAVVDGGGAVACCFLDTQLRAHTGYEPDADDRADVRALCLRFGVRPPAPYRAAP